MKVNDAYIRKKELDERIVKAVQLCKESKSPITVIHFDKEDIQALISIEQSVNLMRWKRTSPWGHDEKTRRITEKQNYDIYHRCPKHDEVIRDYLYNEFVYYLEKLEPMNRNSGYIVHFHIRCPWL